MQEIIASLTELINALKHADPEIVVTMIGIFLIMVIALLIDKLIHGPDASNTWRRRDG